MRRSVYMAALYILSLLILPCVASAAGALRDEVNDKFIEAKKQFRIGEVDKAGKLLTEVIKLKPKDSEAFLLSTTHGFDAIFDFLSEEKTKTQATTLIRQANAYRSAVRSNAKALRKLASKDLNTEESTKRWRAMHSLVASGPYAVPFLIDTALNPAIPKLTKAAAINTLQRISRDGAPPLRKLLWHADDATVSFVLLNLPGSLNTSAVPALLSIHADPKRPKGVKILAAQAIRKMKVFLGEKRLGLLTVGGGEITDIQRCVKSCILLANRYYYSDARIVEVVPVKDRVIWTWNAKGKDLGEKLTSKKVPTFAYPRILARETAVGGLLRDPGNAALLEVYASNNYMFLDEALAAKDGNAKQLLAVLPLNKSLGTKIIAASLDRAIADRNLALAHRTVEALRQIGDSRPGYAIPSLLKAGVFSDPLVRVSAAEAVMSTTPSGALGNDPKAAEQVFETILAGMGVRARMRVAVVTTDDAILKTANALIFNSNAIPANHDDIPTALGQLKSTLGQAEALILDARGASERACGIVESLMADGATSGLPIVLIANTPEREKIQKRCGNKVVAVAPVNENHDALTTAVQVLMKKATAQKQSLTAALIPANRVLLKRVLSTLRSLPSDTAFLKRSAETADDDARFNTPPPAARLGDAVAKITKGNYPKDIRILAFQVLGDLIQTKHSNLLFAIFADAKEAADIRLAAGKVFLTLLPRAPNLIAPQRKRLMALAVDSNKAIAAQAVSALAITTLAPEERRTHFMAVDAPISALR
jgi:hypothetical protein